MRRLLMRSASRIVCALWMASSDVVTYLHTDHLGTPRYGTNSGGTQVWSWDSDAFGIGSPTGSVTVNLRFPGQYFDAESDLHYNWNRYYNPETGRYVASDPIGLGDGLNTYLYANASPVMYSDPEGLKTIHCESGVWRPGCDRTNGGGAAVAGGVAGGIGLGAVILETCERGIKAILDIILGAPTHEPPISFPNMSDDPSDDNVIPFPGTKKPETAGPSNPEIDGEGLDKTGPVSKPAQRCERTRKSALTGCKYLCPDGTSHKLPIFNSEGTLCPTYIYKPM